VSVFGCAVLPGALVFVPFFLGIMHSLRACSFGCLCDGSPTNRLSSELSPLLLNSSRLILLSGQIKVHDVSVSGGASW